MRLSGLPVKWFLWVVAVSFLLTAGVSLLNGDPLRAVSAALFSASFVLAALGVETSRRPGPKMLVGMAVAALVLCLLSLY